MHARTNSTSRAFSRAKARTPRQIITYRQDSGTYYRFSVNARDDREGGQSNATLQMSDSRDVSRQRRMIRFLGQSVNTSNSFPRIPPHNLLSISTILPPP